MPFDATPPTKTAAPILDPDVKRAWVDALRSGKYEQITGCLGSRRFNGRCVMGVYNEVHHDFYLYDADDPFLGDPRDDDVGKHVKQLIARNNGGESFASLANWIESNL